MKNPSRRSILKGTIAGSAALGAPLAVASPARAAGSRRIAIIGSGYGGAVAARSLADAGYAADLIEMGMDWEKVPLVGGRIFDNMTSPSARSMWFQNETEPPFSSFLGFKANMPIKQGAGALGIERFAEMKVYLGRGVGGGSLVNGGMAVTPDRAFFKAVLPQLNADEMFATYFPRANSRLKTAIAPVDVRNSAWYKFSQVGLSQAGKAGLKIAYVPNVYDWDYMRAEIAGTKPGSATAGEVIYGNNYGKRSLSKTYLASALASGKIKLVPMTEVTQIRRLSDGTYSLALKTINFDGVVVSTREAVYDRVVLAGGSIGTSKLLSAAKAKGHIPGLNSSVGKKWGPNGNTMVARYLGFTATGSKQGTIPVTAINAWDNSANSVFAEIAPLPLGIETMSSNYLAITNNPNLGSFGYDAATGKTTLSWTRAMMQPSTKAAKTVMDKLSSANFGSSYRTDLFKDRKIFSDDFTYHPLGGMVIGEATDLNGEVKGAPGLFVMDGSLIPGKIGVNPFVTITAIAERNMDKLLAAGRFA